MSLRRIHIRTARRHNAEERNVDIHGPGNFKSHILLWRSSLYMKRKEETEWFTTQHGLFTTG
jgi:hypothetical protein